MNSAYLNFKSFTHEFEIIDRLFLLINMGILKNITLNDYLNNTLFDICKKRYD